MRRRAWTTPATILAWLTAATVGLAASTGEARLAGQWRGVVTEGSVGEYVMVLVIDEDGASGAVAYCKHFCGGTLTLIEQRDGAYVFAERLTFGQDICLDNLTTRVTVVSENELLFEEIYEGQPALSGRLRRVTGALDPNCAEGEGVLASFPSSSPTTPRWLAHTRPR